MLQTRVRTILVASGQWLDGIITLLAMVANVPNSTHGPELMQRQVPHVENDTYLQMGDFIERMNGTKYNQVKSKLGRSIMRPAVQSKVSAQLASTMSGSYYALRRKMPAFKTYGFRKANQSEIDEINRRMMKPTASSQVSQLNLYSDEKDYQKRPRSACVATPCCAKHQFDNQGIRAPKRVNERHINRIVRRLQATTFSFEAHTADDRLDNLECVLSKLPPRPKTASSGAFSTNDKTLAIQRLQRPTTATCLKRVGFCFYCDGEEEMRKYKRRQVQPLIGPRIKEEEKVIISDDFNNEKVLTSTELEEVTKRMRTPTHASNGGTPVCKRLPEATTVTVYDSRSLPLASGLPRTNTIDDIVNRLYRPTYTMPICRHPTNNHVR